MARYTQRPENALKRANGKCSNEQDIFRKKKIHADIHTQPNNKNSHLCERVDESTIVFVKIVKCQMNKKEQQ